MKTKAAVKEVLERIKAQENNSQKKKVSDRVLINRLKEKYSSDSNGSLKKKILEARLRNLEKEIIETRRKLRNG